MSKTKTTDKPEEPVIEKVHGEPAKNFFVSMLTRDIELKDAVLDLLDNCIDGILRSEKPSASDETPYKGFWAKITFSGKTFRIEDNCGGIPWDIAEDYAFRLGKPADAPARPDRSIGLVGIGMKRALFKLGMHSIVHSYHADNSFEVEIKPEWFTSTSWDFPARREKMVGTETGTTIEVPELHKPISKILEGGANSSFHRELVEAINLHYCYIIHKGFRVEINGEKAKAEPVTLITKDNLQPYIYEASIGGVDVFLAVGFSRPMPSEEQQESLNEGQHNSAYAGWTVICNDRVVLANDKSRLTGWGDAGVPNYHTQFIGIRGVVEFSGKDTAKLPVTTTKRGIDANSDLYLRVRERMQFGLKRFISNTNEWKGHETQHKELVKGATVTDLETIKRSVKKKSPDINLKAVPGASGEKHSVPNLPTRREPKTDRTLSFTRPISQIDEVALYLFGDEQRSASEVAGMCFDRTLKEAKK